MKNLVLVFVFLVVVGALIMTDEEPYQPPPTQHGPHQ